MKMFNLMDMIALQMRKKGMKSNADLLRAMNELNDGVTYTKEHLWHCLNGVSMSVPYLYAMEKVFGLPENTLIKMADLSATKKKYIRNGGK